MPGSAGQPGTGHPARGQRSRHSDLTPNSPFVNREDDGTGASASLTRSQAPPIIVANVPQQASQTPPLLTDDELNRKTRGRPRGRTTTRRTRAPSRSAWMLPTCETTAASGPAWGYQPPQKAPACRREKPWPRRPSPAPGTAATRASLGHPRWQSHRGLSARSSSDSSSPVTSRQCPSHLLPSRSRHQPPAVHQLRVTRSSGGGTRRSRRSRRHLVGGPTSFRLHEADDLNVGHGGASPLAPTNFRRSSAPTSRRSQAPRFPVRARAPLTGPPRSR